jgi:hypothetical protein
MPARDGDHRAGRIDTRAIDDALVNGALETEHRPAYVANGGEAAHQSVCRLVPSLIDNHWHAMLARATPAEALGDVGFNNLCLSKATSLNASRQRLSPPTPAWRWSPAADAR